MPQSTHKGDKWERDEFFNAAQHPDFPNEMRFQIDYHQENDDRTFSIDGLETFLENMRDFVLARVRAEWNRTGKPPKHLGANLQLRFTPAPNIHEGLSPWWQLNDTGDHEPDMETFWKIVTEGRIERNQG